MKRVTATPTPISDRVYQTLYEEAFSSGTLLFDSSQWLQWFIQYSKPPYKGAQLTTQQKQAQRAMRRMIQNGTLCAIRQRYYHVLPTGNSAIQNTLQSLRSSPQVVFIDEELLYQSCRSVQFYTSKEGQSKVRGALEIQRQKKPSLITSIETQVLVMSGDCLEAALLMKERYHKVAVLNMASDKRPGGGYKEGSAAQEENLFRRTSLAFSLENIDAYDDSRDWSYPIPEFGGIYLPDTLVIRGSEQKGYPFLKKAYSLDIITVAAYARPPLVASGKLLEASIADRTKQKIRTIFTLAHLNNVDCLVLSAFGCGAYRNPVGHIASLFHEVLNEFDGLFQCVVFAIYDDHNANLKHNPDGNLKPFERVFLMDAITVDWNERV